MSTNQTPETYFEADQPKRELTFGEKAVGITFNPGRNALVEEIKDIFAEAIDLLESKRNPKDGSMQKTEVARMYSIAITELQTAQMWAVKAATWQY